MKDFIVIHPNDNVAVVLRKHNDIPVGHKFALKRILKGEQIIKYGFPIGHATEDIEEGQLVDHKNISTNLAELQYYDDVKITNVLPESQYCFASNITSFLGYRRKDGQVGVRNELWVLPTVGCVNDICRQIVEQFKAEQPNIEGVDAVRCFPHNYGCSQLGDDHENTRKILRDVALHPNAGGVLIVGLGCENNQPHEFIKMLGDYDKERIDLLVCQEVDGDEVEAGVAKLRNLYHYVQQLKRESSPTSKLKIGLKCGGSDGLSGITANPLLGAFSDWLCHNGGTTVLTEVPEMFGAETLLMQRAANKEVKEKIVELINGFKQYYLSHGQPVGENPSPGNKAGGISTLEEKALGCTQKSGSSTVMDVIHYGERIKKNGLNLLEAPGNDLVASTALAAAGCQIVLFTTGRGTPFSTFVPTMKISTNTELFTNKNHWIDLDAGQLLGDIDIKQLLPSFIQYILDIASGTKTTRAEQHESSGIAIFKSGVTL